MKYDANSQFHRRHLATAIVSALMDAGYERNPHFEGKYTGLSEAVFTRKVNDEVIVAVYTSCNYRSGAWEARNSGKDAIRVATLKVDGDYRQGLAKQQRVFRTGRVDAIVERLKSRCHKAWEAGMRPTRCYQCNAVKFVSKKGNLVCSDFCWTKRPTYTYRSF